MFGGIDLLAYRLTTAAQQAHWLDSSTPTTWTDLKSYTDSQPPTPTIEGENFANFLDLCFECADYFTLTTRIESPKSDLLKMLCDCHVADFLTAEWYCQDACYADRSPRLGLRVHIFRTTNHAKQTILAATDNIFLDFSDRRLIAEDLCFFVGDELLLGTVSHEFMCYLYPQTPQILEKFAKYAIWAEESEMSNESLRISTYFDLSTLQPKTLFYDEKAGILSFSLTKPTTKILELCFDYADYFTLTTMPEKSALDGMPILAEDFVADFITDRWYSFVIHKYNPDERLRIAIFNAKGAREKILRRAVNIYLANTKISDICFFADGEMFLGTVSDPKICTFYPKSPEMLEKFRKHAVLWEQPEMASEIMKLEGV
ncbi:MAG: hypothetical protein FWG65_08435 [Turicibacter sp.]|nr:hypothetical protein [Turicibacter sp.]